MADVKDTEGLSVSLVPASIEANFAALEERVDAMIADYLGAVYDTTDQEAVRQAKRDRTYLNGIAREIDERRKAVKREYMRPLEEFEARAKAISAKVKEASAGIKAQLDEAERRRRDAAYAELRAHYEEVAGLLAPVVPYERIHEPQWTNKTFGEVRALEAVDAKVAKAAEDWSALREMEGMPHYAEAERAFFDTLDLGAALSAAREAQAADERIAEMRGAIEERDAAQEEADRAAAARLEPEPEPAPAPAPAAPPAPPAPEPCRPWVVIVEAATRTDMRGLADVLSTAGITGTIRQGTLEQVYRRESSDGR